MILKAVVKRQNSDLYDTRGNLFAHCIVWESRKVIEINHAAIDRVMDEGLNSDQIAKRVLPSKY